MSHVQTVLGEIGVDQLGTTLMHEHFFVSSAAANYREPTDVHRLAMAHAPVSAESIDWVRHTVVNCIDNLVMMDEDTAIDEGNAVVAAGGMSVIDVTPIGVGRNPLGLAAVARATGLNVVMGCGYYVQATHPPGLDSRTADDITTEIVGEMRDGIADTGIRPGLIGEIGCSWPFYESEQKVLRAAIAAQREMNCALSIHPGRHPDAPDEILALVEAEGGILDRTILCHVDRTADSVKAVKRWAETGCVIEYDLFGVEPPNGYYDDLGIKLPTDEERLDILEDLLESGFGRQVVISHDLCFKHQLARFGGFGRDHILRKVVPKMGVRGFDQGVIDMILIENPRRILAVDL